MTHINEVDYPIGRLGIGSAVSGYVHVAFGDKHIAFRHGGTLKYVLCYGKYSDHLAIYQSIV